jgi:hypothetical protein
MPAKNFDELEDDDIELDDLDDTPMDIEEIKANLPNYPTRQLCEMIVCDRYFGCYRDIAIMCMEELGRRRAAGDDFPFETFIDDSLAELPKLDFSVPDLGDVLRQVIHMKGNS